MTICHVAVYCRRSIDKDDTAVSVSVQEKACRRYAQDHWPDLPVEAYVDNAITAADATVVRPAFERMIEAVRAGRVAQVVVREQSRITRQVEQWEAICRTLQLAGILVLHQTQGGPVSVTEGSRLPGRLMSVVDAEMVEQTKVKTRATLRDNAEEGRPHGYPGYGFRAGRDDAGRPTLEPVPEQVAVITRILEELAAGHSLAVVARGLNDREVPTARGAARWTPSAVRVLATAPRLVGLRTHKGKTYPARWEPVVDRDLWDRAMRALGAPRSTLATRRRYLLTGLVVCDACDTPLISHRYSLRGSTEPGYACPHPSRPDGGCGHCAILAERLEGHVLETVGGWIAEPDFAEAVDRLHAADASDLAPVRAELADVETRLAHLAEQWAAGEVLELETAPARRLLLERRAALLGELDRHPVPQEATGEELAAAWQHAREVGDVEGLRAVLRVVVGSLRVRSGFRDGRRLATSERVNLRPRWVEQES